ncbi:flagellar FlbD family protein [Gorillibacterium massiliense]|uniref:flagellar FlbD family protein n=1 Tax=Gorillibacterium massiliense TaxID=1280390 RepID=UPI0004BCC186|nr:flagellar FlbD family protein [Gorillibacterium massiliense]
MITVTRLNGNPLIINALLIEIVEETPDTMITLTTGRKVTCLEPVQEVVARVVDYIRTVGAVRGSINSQDSEE